MSLTKRSKEYARSMDELFREDTTDHDLRYQEFRYLQSKKAQQPEQPPKGTKSKPDANDH